VQLPGKKQHRIQLLSGGEKALTAVALLFAIFFFKSSTFFACWMRLMQH